MLISSKSYEIHTSILKRHGIKLSHAREIVSAAYGFKSFASLKANNPSLEAVDFLVLYDGVKDRVEKLGIQTISEAERLNICHRLLTGGESSCFSDIAELVEYLTETGSDLIQELESELEEACNSSYNYMYEGCEVVDVRFEDTDGLTIYIDMSAYLPPVPDRMISTDANSFELSAEIVLKKVTPNGFSFYELKRCDITGTNTFYGADMEESE